MAKVLVADDEPLVRELLVEAVIRCGHSVIEAEDGGMALETAQREHPDLILLDMMMPVLDGIEVLIRLKSNAQTQAVPVIMVTARGRDFDEQRGLRAGAWGYVRKPWTPGELEERIGAALADRRSQSETRNAPSGPQPPSSV